MYLHEDAIGHVKIYTSIMRMQSCGKYSEDMYSVCFAGCCVAFVQTSSIACGFWRLYQKVALNAICGSATIDTMHYWFSLALWHILVQDICLKLLRTLMLIFIYIASNVLPLYK